MKMSYHRSSFFAQAVLASTIFCLFPVTADAALTEITVSTTTAATPDAGGGAGGLGGYDINSTAPVTLTVTDGYTIGQTPSPGGVSVSNSSVGESAFLTFMGASTVQGTIGSLLAPITEIDLQSSSTVQFLGNAFVANNLTFDPGTDGILILADGVTFTGSIDNLSTANTNTLIFRGSGAVTGSIGSSNALKLIIVNELEGANKTVTLSGTTVQAEAINVDDNAHTPTTLVLNNAAMDLIAPNGITPFSFGLDILNIQNAQSLTGNIGASGIPFALLKVGQNGNTTINGDIFAILTQFQGNNTLTLGAGSNITDNGRVDTTSAGSGSLTFLGSSLVEGPIGLTNALNALNVSGGAGTIVELGSITQVTNGINFINGAAASSTVQIDNDASVLGSINNNTTTNGIGTVTFTGAFAGVSTVSGTIGATRSINTINIQGAGSTVNFQDNVNVSNAIIFDGTADGTTTVTLADGKTITGNIDNTNGPPTGNLEFLGSGAVTGSIGATNPLNVITINQTEGPNKTVTLSGTIVRAATINVDDDTTIPTTLVLNNAAMNLTAPITVSTNNLDILNIQNALSLTGNIGAPGGAFRLLQVGQNGNTTINGDIFATTTQFQGNNTLILGNGSDINGNVDSSNSGSGIIDFLGNSTVTGTIGAVNALNALNLEGAGQTVLLQGDVQLATGANFISPANATSTLELADGVTFTGFVDNKTGTAGNGIVQFDGSGTISGPIGATQALNAINLNGANGSIVNLNGNFNTTSGTNFLNDSTLNIGNNVLVDSNITTSINMQGTVNFLGNSTVNEQIGGVGKALKAINIQGGSGTVVTLSPTSELFATNTNVTGSGTTLSIDPSTQPLTITGNFDLGSGTTLGVNLNSALPAQIVVTGQANINPGAQLTLTNIPQVIRDGVSTFIIVEGGAGSTINAIPASGNSLLHRFTTFAGGPGNDDLILEIDSLPASEFANQSNTIGIAGALDAINNTGATGTLFEIISQLATFTDIAALNQALAALAPIVDDGIVYESFNSQFIAWGAVEERLRRKKVKGFSAGDADCGDECAKKNWPFYILPMQESIECGRGRWGKLYAQKAHQKERQGIPGYHNYTLGISVGQDIITSEHNLIGGVLALTNFHLNHNISDSRTHALSFQGGAYGQHEFMDYWFLNWLGTLAYNDYSTQRNFNFGNLSLSPRAHYNAWQWTGMAEVGYEYIEGIYHIIPLAGLYYSHLDLAGYTETNVNNADQSVKAHDYDLLRGGIGVRAAINCPYAQYTARIVTLQPEVHFMAFHDFINDRMETTSQFVGGGPSFVTRGFTPAANSIKLGASLTALSNYSDLIFTVHYDLDLKENYTSSAGFLRVRYEF